MSGVYRAFPGLGTDTDGDGVEVSPGGGHNGAAWGPGCVLSNFFFRFFIFLPSLPCWCVVLFSVRCLFVVERVVCVVGCGVVVVVAGVERVVGVFGACWRRVCGGRWVWRWSVDGCDVVRFRGERANFLFRLFRVFFFY